MFLVVVVDGMLGVVLVEGSFLFCFVFSPFFFKHFALIITDERQSVSRISCLGIESQNHWTRQKLS